ncbi:hypothetical protein ZWY2020_005530 [Hordeum vulgare]|nr:hypothetical protein ZWY2020_005530 [Hordeum vulgare]
MASSYASGAQPACRLLPRRRAHGRPHCAAARGPRGAVLTGRFGRLAHPLLLVQVNEFTCDGFTVAATWNHELTDGDDMAQFLGAVGELARGAFMAPTTARSHACRRQWSPHRSWRAAPCSARTSCSST